MLGTADISYASPPIPQIPIFEVVVDVNVSDYYDYQYTLKYSDYPPLPCNTKGISHWWLEVSCAHSSIDTIYGYSIIDNTQYDWIVDFNPNLGGVEGYTDWVIKWDLPDNIPGGELPKDPGATIGYFGFHSFQPPITGNWGAKGSSYFATGETLVPQCIPEPATMLLLGIGVFGFSIRKSKNLIRRR